MFILYIFFTAWKNIWVWQIIMKFRKDLIAKRTLMKLDQYWNEIDLFASMTELKVKKLLVSCFLEISFLMIYSGSRRAGDT